MGFWDDFTGKTAAKQANQSSAAATDLLGQGQDYQAARYRQAQRAVGSGAQAGRGALQQGATQAAQSIRRGHGQAGQATKPYERTGYVADQRYGAALGLQGAKRQQQFVNSYMGNPFMQSQIDQGVNAVKRQGLASGDVDSGNALIAGQRVAQEMGYQDYNQHLDRLAQLAGRGTDLARERGSYGIREGEALSGIYGDQGRGTASLYGDEARMRAGLYENQGRGEMDYYGALAGNEIDRGNAVASARAHGTNNILSAIGGIGSAALGGFAPGLGGTSAFGNMSNWLGGRRFG